MKICVFGDSITWGFNDYFKGGWVERLKTYCMENKEDIDVYNLGVPGDSTDDLIKRFAVEATTREPDLIIFAIGINDSQYIQAGSNYRVDLDKFENNISKLTKNAKKITDSIMFVGLTRVDEPKTTPIPWNTEKYYYNKNIEKYDTTISKFCEKNELNYVGMKRVVDAADLVDGLHPNAEGHEKMFRTVLGAIDKFLQTQK